VPRAEAHRCLAVTPPGAEELTARELTGLGVNLRRTFRGGVEFRASDRQLYAANLWTRTATRIVVRVARFVAPSFADLERELSAVPWDRFLAHGTTPDVRVSSTSSRLYHTDAVAERVVRATATGPHPSGLIVVRVVHDRVMVSVDSSGAPLHQRGWRLDQGQAPLRETLAAASLLASGWDPSAPLVDLCEQEDLVFLPWAPIQQTGRKAAVAVAAQRRGVTERQIVLAWLLASSPAILPIPGTGSPEHAEENVAAVSIELSRDELEAISKGG